MLDILQEIAVPAKQAGIAQKPVEIAKKTLIPALRLNPIGSA